MPPDAGQPLVLPASSATTETAADSGPSEPYVPDGTPKLDLLLVVDNSASMRDKAVLLAESVREMLRKLVDPPCVTDDGQEVNKKEDACPAGSAPPHPPLNDIHVGVLTTSLGGYGAEQPCAVDPENPNTAANDDSAHLVGSLARANGAGGGDFVEWAPGDTDLATFQTNVQAQISAAGSNGCGYEAPLEAWTRFLVDPLPYTRLIRQPCNTNDTANSCNGPERDANGEPMVDEVLLAQRRAFLRPDSLVSIVVLTDENDCSMRASGQTWLVADANPDTGTFKGSATCATDPDDMCCQSCGRRPLVGCPADESGSAVGCETSTYPAAVSNEPSDDPTTLRCYKQKQRFGTDFLFPPARYLNALTQRWLCQTDYALHNPNVNCDVENPLLVSGGYERPAQKLFLTTISGVPWQDVAVDPEADVLRLRNTRPTGDEDAFDWGLLLGSADSNGRRKLYPTNDGTIDPLMYESIEPRTGTHPRLEVEMEDPLAGYMAHPINGHERNIVNRDDLQHACIFPLATPRQCKTEEDAEAESIATGLANTCECTVQGNDEWRSPLCQTPEGAYGLTQGFTRATPGTRLYQAQELIANDDSGVNGIVGSICPKSLEPAARDFAYRPTLDALRHLMASQL